MKPEELQVLAEIFMGGTSAMSDDLNPEVAAKIEAVIRKYQKSEYNVGDCIICMDTSAKFGRIEMRTVEELDDYILEEGDNKIVDGSGYASIICKGRYFYFGPKDKMGEEPYNRQSPLYVPVDWSQLRCIHKRTKNDLYTTAEYRSNISFSIQKFYYNNIWKTIRFGVVVDEDKKHEFINSVVTLLKL